MCLAAFALNAHPRFPLVIAANRDEFYARAAAPMAWWDELPGLLAGRDLEAGGTWFGLTRAGRVALLTNVREPGRQQGSARSRGDLVLDWLVRQEAGPVAPQAAAYNGFNLVTGDLSSGTWGTWHWASNRAGIPVTAVALGPGLHAVSNALLDTPWPKTAGLKADLAAALASATHAEPLAEQLLHALADTRRAPDAELPDTGVGLERERLLSPRLVRIPRPDDTASALYGTRCSTVLVREVGGRTLVIERTLTATGGWLAPVVHTLASWP